MQNGAELKVNLGLMIDCSRNSVMNLTALKNLIPILSKAGYNSLQLYTEDTYEVKNEPYFGYFRGRYTKSEIRELDSFAASYGIELIPCIQTLAHVRALFRWPQYREINDTADILLAEDERTYSLIDNMFSSLAECFSSRNVNIGMDEAHNLGQGRYKERHGETPRADIMLAHLKRVNEIANRYGFTCSMWSDMFFYMAFGDKNYASEEVEIPKEIKEKIPENIKLIYWDYYSLNKNDYAANIRSHKKLTKNIVFAGGLWSWAGLTPLNYWGIQAARAAMEACRENNISEIFTTAWGDGGGSCSPYSVLPALIHTAEYAKGNFDENSIKRRFFEIVGIKYENFIAVDLPNFLYDEQDKTVKCNPAKYLLYNDVLTGVYDSTIGEGGGEIYKAHAQKLKKSERDIQFGFIFKTLRSLCECLYYKMDLGIVTRRLYRSGDKEGLKRLITERYKPLIIKIKAFYKNLREYWYKLYKPYGFEITDIRLGGLNFRLKDVMYRLSDYVNGKTAAIPELEEPLLDRNGGGNHFEKQLLLENTWGAIVTLNLL